MENTTGTSKQTLYAKESKIDKEVKRLLKDNDAQYAVLNLQECNGEMCKLEEAMTYLTREHPTLNYILVTATPKQLSVLCKSTDPQSWYDHIRNNVVSGESHCPELYSYTNLDGVVRLVVQAEITDLDTTVNQTADTTVNYTQYPEKLRDDIMNKAFGYLRMHSFIPEPEEDEYVDPEACGLGAW